VTHDPRGREKSYIFENGPAKEETYGRLYSWDVAMNGSTAPKARGLAPQGWLIPDDDRDLVAGSAPPRDCLHAAGGRCGSRPGGARAGSEGAGEDEAGEGGEHRGSLQGPGAVRGP
jgi:hypothetical protein